MLQDVLKTIEAHQRFVLTSHARPDGDAVGSALACGEVLRQLGKKAEVVLSDGVPHIYRPLPFAEGVIHAQSVPGKFDAAVILECDSVQRTRLANLEQHLLINIDHHSSGKPFAQVNWIDPTACATAEMIYRLALEAGVKITPQIATCLYTAVLTDTGSFTFPGTTPRTFELAEDLVRLGADPVKIAQALYLSQPLAKMLLLGKALSDLSWEGKLNWMRVTRAQMAECHALDEDCEGLVNFALSVAGIELTALFREYGPGPGGIRVSLRSKGQVNVAAIAEEFGGGGHECASGFFIDDSMANAEQQVIARLRQALASLSVQ
jgi:bifunctional oligoribonuclease and PAP phosphatase NrnA